jgi:outer membrane protein
VLGAMAVSLAGCATSALEMAPARPNRPWVPATTATGEIIPGMKPAPEPPTGATYVLPSNSALAGVAPAPPLEQDRTYSLPELIDIAQSNNPLTRTAWNLAREAALAAGIAESTYLPKLTASVLGGYQTSHGQTSALGTSVQGDLTAHGALSSVSLQWLLFDFGERSAVVEAAKQGSVISNIAFTAAHQKLIYEVSLAFYAHAAATARVDTALQTLKNADEVQAAAEDRYQHGIGTVIEVAQTRQATAQARLLQVQAQGGAQDAYLALITAMGISPLTRIKIARIADRKLSPSMTDSVERIIAAALARRPDVLSAYAAEKASFANVRAARAEFLPKFFLSATGAYNNGGLDVTAIPSIGQQSGTVNLSGHRLSGVLFAGMAVPLYDGGTRAALLKQAQAKADNAHLVLTRTRDEAVRQIVQAENALQTSLSAYSASTSLASAAQTTFDAALAAYRSGVGSITDVSLAESQLLQAKNASTDAYSTALSAAATLALAAGTLGAAPE